MILARAAMAAIGLAAAGSVQAASFQSLYSFDQGNTGAGPYGTLLEDHAGLLYGTTDTAGPNGGGTVFKFDPATSTLTTLFAFTLSTADGAGPASGLIAGPHNLLYGVTERGGTGTCSYGCGTLFQIDKTSGALTTLHSFHGAGDGQTPAAKLYRDASGALFGTTITGGYTANGTLYGYGTVFKYDPGTAAFTTLHQFSVGSINDGNGPEAALVPGPNGLLYGTASGGGAHGSGVIYTIDPATNTFALVHAFDYHVDGDSPDCDLDLVNGIFYGSTAVGGPTDATDGTLFKLDPATNTVTTLYSFPGGGSGTIPQPGVTRGKNGLLYGPTSQGGASGAGTLFSFSPAHMTLKLVHDFSIGDGVSPSGRLTLDKSGALYGVTSGGGSGSGTIFRVVP